MGWGDIDIDIGAKGVFTNVPYWICRNSWHSGNDFFRIAMYPHNKRVQFEVFSKSKPSSALVFIEPSHVEKKSIRKGERYI